MKKIAVALLSSAILLAGINIVESHESASHTEHSHTKVTTAMHQMSEAHGFNSLVSGESLHGELLAKAGERTLIDAKLMTRPNMSEICYLFDDESELIVNSEGTFLTPSSKEMPRGHFMAKTFPYFILAAYKFTTDDGTIVEDMGTMELDGVSYDSSKITFGDGIGDSPDDYYVLYIDKQTHQLHAIQFIASYGKDDPSKATPYVLTYDEYQVINGVAIPTKMSEYMFEAPDKLGKKIVEITFENPSFNTADPAMYVTPTDSKELTKGG